METIQESISPHSAEGLLGVFKYVFNFDDENKSNILNMLQYTIIAIIPVFLLLKAIKNTFPEEDESKGNLEILAESVGQIITIMLSIWFTNKLVEYIPTYSGVPYNGCNCNCFVVPFLVLLTTMQTKLGAKLNILFDRVVAYVDGKSAQQQQQLPAKRQDNLITVSQPGIKKVAPPQHQPSQADHLDANNLIPQNVSTDITSVNNYNIKHTAEQNGQTYPNGQSFNSPGMIEPMAANESFTGSAW